jgi:hypothetical protein
MPQFGTKLSESEIADLARFIYAQQPYARLPEVAAAVPSH